MEIMFEARAKAGAEEQDGEAKVLTVDPLSEQQTTQAKVKPHKSKKGASIWEDQPDLVSLHSELDTEQEL